jgi:hypothetical protein
MRPRYAESIWLENISVKIPSNRHYLPFDIINHID